MANGITEEEMQQIEKLRELVRNEVRQSFHNFY
jgi:hypothetical protein